MSDFDKETIEKRKAEHIAIALSGNADFRAKSTLLEEVELIHDALPDLHVDEVDLKTTLLGKTLAAPLVISAMTGGTPRAAEINRDLARAAEKLGIGFGLGSQKAMLKEPEHAWTFSVREEAPTALVLGNIGLVKARDMSTAELRALVDSVKADALCLHLNPGQELIQPDRDGDRDFRGGRATLRRLSQELEIPVVVKETGCGLSRRVGRVVRDLGIKAVDVSGAGGTSWVAVEEQRAQGRKKRLGQELREWGIPTAASVGLLADLDLEIIATGGLRTGYDVARAIALGATVGGMAQPVLKAWERGGFDGAMEFLEDVIEAVRTVTFLCGCRTPAELRVAPRVIGPRLRAWLEQAR